MPLPIGGSITEGSGFRMHVFTASDSFAVSADVTAAYVLLVGGGGGCAWAQYHGGGGGAGGLVLGTNFIIAAGSHAITVGAGGAGSTGYGVPGSNGADTLAFGLVAKGGGFAGYYSGQPSNSGGSGGGCHQYSG